MLLIEIVSQQAVVDNMTRQSNVLTTYCLTEDDREFLAHSTAQHVHNYQELLEACRVNPYLILISEHVHVTSTTLLGKGLIAGAKKVDLAKLSSGRSGCSSRISRQY